MLSDKTGLKKNSHHSHVRKGHPPGHHSHGGKHGSMRLVEHDYGDINERSHSWGHRGRHGHKHGVTGPGKRSFVEHEDIAESAELIVIPNYSLALIEKIAQDCTQTKEKMLEVILEEAMKGLVERTMLLAKKAKKAIQASQHFQHFAEKAGSSRIGLAVKESKFVRSTVNTVKSNDRVAAAVVAIAKKQLIRELVNVAKIALKVLVASKITLPVNAV